MIWELQIKQKKEHMKELKKEIKLAGFEGTEIKLRAEKKARKIFHVLPKGIWFL
jgi:hypothetical protein